jgi:hypothetical protein
MEFIRSLYASYEVGDVATPIPILIQFHLKVPKCDQMGVGSNAIVGCVDSPLCPILSLHPQIQWIARWLSSLPELMGVGISSGGQTLLCTCVNSM